MSKLSSRTAAVVGDLVDTAIMWLDNAGSSASLKATWLVIRTKLETYFPTRSEVTSEIAAAVAGLYDHKGAYNASTNSPDLDTSPSGIKKGDAYTVSVAGTFYAVAVAAGDVLIADQDNPSASTHWTIVNRNLDEDLLMDEGTVDARVMAVASGAQRIFLRPEHHLSRASISSPTLEQHTSLSTYAIAKTYTFSAAGDDTVYWVTSMPPRWDLGSMRFRFYWRPSNTDTGVCRWRALPTNPAADGEVPFGSVGAGFNADDAGLGTAGNLQVSAWTSAMSQQSAAADGDLICILFQRNGVSGSDTFTGTAELIGIDVEWSSDQPTDA